jgi:Novel STAND NTPase 1
MREPEERPNPYVGPRPFDRDDAALFFGREAETLELGSLVIASRLVLVYAASGAGKTSLLNAGLAPLLEREEHFDVLPGARLAGGLDEHTLSQAENVYALSLLNGWAEGSSPVSSDGQELSLAQFLAQRPRAGGADGPAPRALIFDQFEELFSLYPRYWTHQRGFVDQIASALEDDPLLRIVLAIREDYVAQLDAFADALPDGLRTRYRLERLGREQALEAVRRPAERTGRTYGPGVAERLVSDLMALHVDTGRAAPLVVEGPFVEPVQLQVTCQRLWDDLPADVTHITEAQVQTYGDVDHVLAWFYESAIQDASRAGKVRAGRLRRWIEDAFITSGGTRGTVYRSAERTAAIPNASIEALENRHLIRAEWRAGARWYELTHDRLIEPIRKSNERYRAQRRRGRRGRAAVAVASLAVLVVISSLTWLREGDAASGGGGQEVSLSPPDLATNVSFGRYLVATGVKLANPSEAQLRRNGNVLSTRVTTQGYRDARLRLTAVTEATGRELPDLPANTVSVSPRSDLDSTTVSVWLTLPSKRGGYRYVLRLTEGSAVLASTRSEEFAVTAAGRVASPAASPATPTSELLVRVEGPGRVTSPAGIRCPSLCATSVPSGATVRLTAAPSSQATFIGWRGCSGAQAATCTLRVVRPESVAALFELTPTTARPTPPGPTSTPGP